MGASRKELLFRVGGVIGLALLLVFTMWTRQRSVTANHEGGDAVKEEHDHSNPAEHGDVKGGELSSGDVELKPSGKVVDGKRVVDYEAFKFGFSPDPLVVFSGETVVLKLKSRDVEHGIMIPEVDFNSPIPPSKTTTKSFTAPVKPGRYPIFCSTYCGADHGNMRGVMVVVPSEATEKPHHK